jgi:hypothetical protein
MMNSLEAMQSLMKSLGPQTPSIDAVVQNEDRTWAVQFDDASVAFLEWDDQPPRLVITADLGKIEEGRQLEVMRTLLSYNLLWRDTGGVKSAMGGPDGGAMLLYEWHAGEPVLSELQTVLQNFQGIAGAWRRYVESGGTVEEVLPISLQQLGNRA